MRFFVGLLFATLLLVGCTEQKVLFIPNDFNYQQDFNFSDLNISDFNAILKNGLTVTTAQIPFQFGLRVPDNNQVVLSTDGTKAIYYNTATGYITTNTDTYAPLIGTEALFNNVSGGNFILTTSPFQSSEPIQAPRFLSTITTGAQPYTTTSTTLNTNLNADLFDDLNSTDFLRTTGSVKQAVNGDKNFNSNVVMGRGWPIHLGLRDDPTTATLCFYNSAANPESYLAGEDCQDEWYFRFDTSQTNVDDKPMVFGFSSTAAPKLAFSITSTGISSNSLGTQLNFTANGVNGFRMTNTTNTSFVSMLMDTNKQLQLRNSNLQIFSPKTSEMIIGSDKNLVLDANVVFNKTIDLNRSSDCWGLTPLVAGTATVTTKCADRNYMVLLTAQSAGGTPGFVGVTAKNSGNFVLTSLNVLDASDIYWEIHRIVN